MQTTEIGYVETWAELKQRIVEWALANNHHIRSHTHPKTRANWDK